MAEGRHELLPFYKKKKRSNGLKPLVQPWQLVHVHLQNDLKGSPAGIQDAVLIQGATLCANAHLDHIYIYLTLRFVFLIGLPAVSPGESRSAPLPFKVIWNSSASPTLATVCFSLSGERQKEGEKERETEKKNRMEQ